MLVQTLKPWSMTVDFRVKCAYGDEVDITVSVPDNATVDAVISQVGARGLNLQWAPRH